MDELDVSQELKKPMALTKCKECGTAVSTNAKACPRCGAKQGVSTCGCLAAMLIFPFLVIIVIVISGGEGSSPRPAPVSSRDAPPQKINWGVPADPTYAYKLVCLDSGERGISDSDPRILRYQQAIDELGTRFTISEQIISDQTWIVVESLRKQSVKTSAIEIMEGVVGMKETGGISYAEIVATLMTLMQSNSKK